MLLNDDPGSTTPNDVGGHGHTDGPSVKLRGVPLPIHLKDSLERIASLRTKSYKKAGGGKVVSFSDELARAVGEYISRFHKKHGPAPSEQDEESFVARLAASERQELLQSVHAAAGSNTDD